MTILSSTEAEYVAISEALQRNHVHEGTSTGIFTNKYGFTYFGECLKFWSYLFD